MINVNVSLLGFYHWMCLIQTWKSWKNRVLKKSLYRSLFPMKKKMNSLQINCEWRDNCGWKTMMFFLFFCFTFIWQWETPKRQFGLDLEFQIKFYPSFIKHQIKVKWQAGDKMWTDCNNNRESYDKCEWLVFEISLLNTLS